MTKNQGWKFKKTGTNVIVGNEKKPTNFESGQVIINKKATSKNIDKLIDINKEGTTNKSSKVTSDATDGGILKGKSHAKGGIPGKVDGVKTIETEGDEFVVNKEASEKYWKELSKINQSSGNGVPINPPNNFDEDPEEFSKGGKIEFNPNHIPNKWILTYAKNIKANYPKIWSLGGNIFGNQAFKNLSRVAERGYWLDSEEWMYIKWRSYVARHQRDYRIEGVIAMLKWVDKVEKGWPYMKQLIEERIKKIESKKKGWKHKMKEGGLVDEFPNQIKGNDDIIWVKTKQSKDLVNYTPYYRGYNIDIGGYNFGTLKEVKDFISNYILSNQWYNKLRYEPIKELPKMKEGGKITHSFDLKLKNIDDAYKVIVEKNKEVIGELYFIESKFKPNLIATSVSVDPNYRRKGIASSMYVFAEKKLGKSFLKNENVLTPDGKALWGKKNREFGKHKMKEGGHTIAQTPAPKKEQIKGSKVNKPESSASTKSASSIKFDEKTIASIKNKVAEHNKKHPNKKITLASAKAVVRRGMGAYSSSHRPTISGGQPNSRNAWGLARLNAFMYKIVKGKSKSGNYIQDDDLIEELGYSVYKMKGGGNINNNSEFIKWSEKEMKDKFNEKMDVANLYFSIVKDEDGDNNVVKNAYWENSLTNSKYEYDAENFTWVKENEANGYKDGGSTNLLAPNGKPSNLTPEQYKLVRTQEFKNWFGDWENDPANASKVVDENGEPLVVYHGTYVENPFYSFDFDKADLGFHFGTYEQAKNRSETKLFFKGRKSIVNSFFLNIKTIFESTDIGKWEYPQRYIDMFVSDGLINESDAKKNGFYRLIQREENKQIREYLLNKYGKFVGFVYNNKYEGKGKSFIVLNPNQIKLADGTNTTFDSNNTDIRFDSGGELQKGIKAEKEHQSTINKIYTRKVSIDKAAELIAKDHLKEDPKYYSKLEKMEGTKFAQGGLVVNGIEVNIGDIGLYNGRVKEVITVNKITPKLVYYTNDRGKYKNADVSNFIKYFILKSKGTIDQSIKDKSIYNELIGKKIIVKAYSESIAQITEIDIDNNLIKYQETITPAIYRAQFNDPIALQKLLNGEEAIANDGISYKLLSYYKKEVSSEPQKPIEKQQQISSPVQVKEKFDVNADYLSLFEQNLSNRSELMKKVTTEQIIDDQMFVFNNIIKSIGLNS